MSEEQFDHTVMIVEDDSDVREAIAEVLEDNDYRFIAVSNGKEALEHLRAGLRPPCVILLDIMMPVMDGWEFRAQQLIDAALSRIPVVVLSAHANIEEAAQKMKAQFSLRKPVQLPALISAVERFCKAD